MGYAVTPEAVIRHPKLSMQAKALYGILASFMRKDSDCCWPFQSTLAKHANASDRSIRLWLTELEHAGFLRISRSGANSPAHYTLLDRKPASTQTGSPLPLEEQQGRSPLTDLPAGRVAELKAIAARYMDFGGFTPEYDEHTVAVRFSLTEEEAAYVTTLQTDDIGF